MKKLLFILALITMGIGAWLCLKWYDWKLFLIIFIFQFANNLGNKQNE